MISKFKLIVDLCEKRGFLKCLADEVSFGPVGYVLQENLKTEWLHSNLTNRDLSVFLNIKSNFSESYDFVKQICDERLPYGLVNINCKPNIEEKNVTSRDKDQDIDVDQYFRALNQIKLQSFMFISPSTSVQYFHNWQRQRRMWWRKISASPGRYSLTDIQTSAGGEQSVDIQSAYSWGSHIIERIFLNTNGDPSLTKEQLLVKDGRKRVQSHCITSTTYLNSMVLNILCDAYDETVYQDAQRSLLRLHRKVAPYKISFAISSSNSSNAEELNDLGLFLCKKLRGNNVSVLLLPSASRSSLDSQWTHYDQLGIPYCVVLNDGTLKNGVAHLRSRDTTLKEQVHISDLPEYVEKLFRNY